MIVRIEIYNEDEKIAEDTIDLSEKLRERNIGVLSPSVSYTADHSVENNTQTLAVSGGQILPKQNISKIDSITQKTLTINEGVSINIQARYDLNDEISKRWNLDIYVHIHNPNINLKEKRLIKVHSDKIHHLPDYKEIKILSWINNIEQPPIIAKRPKLMSGDVGVK